MPNPSRDIKVANALAAMASDEAITYAPTYNTRRSHYSTVWHEMNATHRDGRTWKYWLARDQGSYRGSFLD